jgi:hypothetical protein
MNRTIGGYQGGFKKDSWPWFSKNQRPGFDI